VGGHCAATYYLTLPGYAPAVESRMDSLSVLGTSLLWRSTAAFTYRYLKVKSASSASLFTYGGLGLDHGRVMLVFVLVLRIWSCLHHWT